MRYNILLVFIYLLVCIVFYYCEQLAAKTSSNKIVGHTNTSPTFYTVIWLNIAGILMFGGVGFFCSEMLGALHLFPMQVPTWSVWLSIAILSTMAFILSWLAGQQKVLYARSCTNKPNQSEVSIAALPIGFTLPRYASYLLIRVAYLFSYEYFYRGIFLFNTSVITGWFWAIAINVVVYLLSHSLASKTEVMGTLPFGIAMCYVSYEAHSFLPAFIVHTVLGFTYENVIFINHFLSAKKPVL